MSKTATMKTAISPARLPKTEPSANSIDFVDEDLALVPVSGLPEEIHRNGRPVILTRKEFKMLAYLIRNPRRVISREELLNEVWRYENYPRTRTVDNHILKLRKKLEAEPAHPKHFHTVHSSGYRFLASTRRTS